MVLISSRDAALKALVPQERSCGVRLNPSFSINAKCLLSARLRPKLRGMESNVPVPVAERLVEIAQSIAFATLAGTTDQRLLALSTYLTAVREALGMEVAFVSQLMEQRRVFKVVSTSPASQSPIRVGRSDALLDTYCMYILQGRLPPVIRDIRTAGHQTALQSAGTA